jgi:hypothetical protein
MSSVFGRTILGNGASASGGSSAGGCSRLQSFCQSYYKNYIATSSIKPVLHVVGFYSALHWTITQSHKHSQSRKATNYTANSPRTPAPALAPEDPRCHRCFPSLRGAPVIPLPLTASDERGLIAFG